VPPIAEIATVLPVVTRRRSRSVNTASSPDRPAKYGTDAGSCYGTSLAVA
jgi:hypothetical protein